MASMWTAAASLGISSPESPSLCCLPEGHLILAWRADDPTNRIYTARLDRDGRILGKWPREFRTTAAPAIALGHDGQVHMVWKANDPSNRIYEAMSEDGEHWTSSTALPFSTGRAPSFGAAGGSLVLAWIANDTGRAIYLARRNGGAWGDSWRLAETSLESPSGAVSDGIFRLAWQDGASQRRLLTGALADGKSLEKTMAVVEICRGRPALASWGGRLLAAWRSGDPDGEILLAEFTGDLWAPLPGTGHRAGSGPCLASADDRLYLAWRAPAPSHEVKLAWTEEGAAD